MAQSIVRWIPCFAPAALQLESDWPRSQGYTLFHDGEHRDPLQCFLITEGMLDTYFIVFFIPGVFLLGYIRLFTFDCSSRVSPHQHFHDAMVSPNQELIEIASIAIWNRNKIATAAAIGVWVINVAFLIQGKSLLPFPTGDPELRANVV